MGKQGLDIANDMPKSQPELPRHKILQRIRLARWPFYMRQHILILSCQRVSQSVIYHCSNIQFIHLLLVPQLTQRSSSSVMQVMQVMEVMQCE